MQFIRNNKVIRVIAFLLVFGIAFFTVQSVFGLDSSRCYTHSRGFFAEKRETLDCVYIGASNVHWYWQPLFGWNEYGIAVYNYSFGSLPMISVRYLMEVARRRQPDALYIINLNIFKGKNTRELLHKLHRFLDYMPVSVDRARVIGDIAKACGLTVSDQLNLLFPIIQFHNRWNDLKGWAFGSEKEYKSSLKTGGFLKNVEDIRHLYTIPEKRRIPEDDTIDTLVDLLDYADRTGAKVLFVKVPQSIDSEQLEYMNTLEDMVLERGYPCLDLQADIAQTGIDLQWDFLNTRHTNVHGSLKYSRYLANYLTENYHFSDKRGKKGWESWDSEGDQYKKAIEPYLLPFECEAAPRTDLEAPVLRGASAEGQTVTVEWKASANADGYRVYRKSRKEDKNRWRLVADVDAHVLSYQDAVGEPSTPYTYTVVGYCIEDGKILYGSFDPTGLEVKTT